MAEEPDSGEAIVKVTAPEGFRASRRVTVVRPAGATAPPVALYIQAFERGIDVVSTEEAITPGSPPWRADEGHRVDLGNGRSGRIVYRTGWAEVRLSLDNKAVRVTSSRPALALAVAGALRV